MRLQKPTRKLSPPILTNFRNQEGGWPMTDKPFPADRKVNSALPQDDGDIVVSLGANQGIMNRVINDFFTSFDFLPLTVFEDTGRFIPKAHITHDPEKIMVTAELPGMDADDIDIIIKSDMLIITGKKKEPGNDAMPASMPDEHGPVSFRKMIPIPCLIDMQKAQAIFTKGILQIMLPKITQDSLTRFRIPIKKD
jgi:HSP20 family protein